MSVSEQERNARRLYLCGGFMSLAYVDGRVIEMVTHTVLEDPSDPSIAAALAEVSREKEKV